ncbi:ribosome small subunit-dependent GTPase A [uncultured Lactobacillus sp.]|uniref:ribosome small subunit-dependent GTPase A n=1 Tax=uncultured Lactobacillus sp. TaxID=153152 RepID=UPI0025F9EC0C|nr:ribosome small subunit-dependent GTPase A [uncultured Lactobacillus sp.]
MIKKDQGIVIGLIAGFYDVQTANDIVRTRARGVFRKNKLKPTVGDHVKIQIDDQGTNYLVEVLPRKNLIGRPALANVNHVLLVMSAVQPDFSLQLLDRFLTFFSWQGVAVSIYLSKSDLLSSSKLNKIHEDLLYYNAIGYRIYYSQEEVANNLIHEIANKDIWTLAGQSGAGKSTLINSLQSDVKQETGAISNSLNRGKHTTRTVNLFPLGKGYLADTPGFSAIDLTPIKVKELCDYFIEFRKASSNCKFRGCQHLNEPSCEVKRLVEAGKIKKSRYDDYLLIRKEIENGRLPEYLK